MYLPQPGLPRWSHCRCQYRKSQLSPIIGIGREKTIKTLKPLPRRPVVKRPRWRGMCAGQMIPFTQSQCSVTGLAQVLRNGACITRNSTVISGKLARSGGMTTNIDTVWHSARHERGSRRGADWCSVVVCKLEPLCCKAVNIRGFNQTAVRRDLGKPNII